MKECHGPDHKKRVVEAAEVRERDYLIWDDELPGFELWIFSSGKRSYVIQYRTSGRSRRYTIGLHGAWAPEINPDYTHPEGWRPEPAGVN